METFLKWKVLVLIKTSNTFNLWLLTLLRPALNLVLPEGLPSTMDIRKKRHDTVWAQSGDRTRDLVLTKDALYHWAIWAKSAKDIQLRCSIVHWVLHYKRTLRFYPTPTQNLQSEDCKFCVLGEGFEPSESFRTTVLQTVAIVHSAIPASEPRRGVEPRTYCLQNSCSTTELSRQMRIDDFTLNYCIGQFVLSLLEYY